ncbi:MAG: UDP-2,3-diacylglucosamine hydrolase, partial [Microvirga sp.]|nr:UDP-2,3-diacylglucosamine hydrolase [Microvirga sp.]
FGVAYMNTGDWVESCTAVVEHYDGSFQLVRWTDVQLEKAAEQNAVVPTVSEKAA